MRRLCGRSVSDSGSAAVELVLAVPLLVLCMFVVVGLGRLVGARLAVNDAAYQAARAASLARTPGEAGSAAEAAARSSLAGRGSTCGAFSVRTHGGGGAPGGVVRVRVTCHADLGELTMSGLPGRVAVAGDAVSPVDRFRSSP
ncbi:TadE/TadG family type IV pilus assembly protein [Streptomyces monticola]|uniref:TadE/TadG family type IV pilus assembly protein n=1 Tax=Streptomyces monticola TaxID=2666263 RepID=A0ABW2JN95_9ACTN